MRNPISVIKKYFSEHGTRRSSKWPEVRKHFLKKNPTCAACGAIKNLEAHHVKPFHLYPELELDEDNLIALCEVVEIGSHCDVIFKEHHLKIGHTVDGKSSWKTNNPNVREDAAKHLAQIKG